MLDRHVIGSWDKLIDYCTATMAHNSTEQFRVMFLGHRNSQLTDKVTDAVHKLAISAYDHLIICRSGHQSTKTLRLI